MESRTSPKLLSAALLCRSSPKVGRRMAAGTTSPMRIRSPKSVSSALQSGTNLIRTGNCLAVSASHEEIFLLSVYCKRPCTFHRLLFFLFSVNSASPRPLWVNRFLSFLFFLFPSSSFSSLALKLCKQLQRIEESAVSYQR